MASHQMTSVSKVKFKMFHLGNKQNQYVMRTIQVQTGTEILDIKSTQWQLQDKHLKQRVGNSLISFHKLTTICSCVGDFNGFCVQRWEINYDLKCSTEKHTSTALLQKSLDFIITFFLFFFIVTSTYAFSVSSFFI